MTPTVAIVGGALRGSSLLERIGAAAARRRSRRVHVVIADPHPPGAGAVWRTDQSPLLLMNTPASAATLWPDDCDRGLSLWEWVHTVASSEDAIAADTGLRTAVLEATPESFLPRVLHGHYLRWAYRRIVDDLPDNVSHEWRRERVTSIRRDGPLFRLLYACSGTEQVARAVVLATGWSDDTTTARVGDGLLRIGAGSPIRQDLDAVTPGAQVLSVGMGLSFFDAVTLLTAGRGGTFAENGAGLTYRPSGAEPVIVAASRRGFPYRSRLRGGLNHRAAHASVKAAALQDESSTLDFSSHLLPRILHDAGAAYYETLAIQRPDAVTASVDDLADVFSRFSYGDPELAEILAQAVTDPADLFDATTLLDPAPRTWDSPEQFRATVLAALHADIAAAGAAVDSPNRVAVKSFCEARRVLVPIIRHGALRSATSIEDHRRYVDRVSFLSNGPPVRRLRELEALLRAGVVDVLGPGVREHSDLVDERLVADSAAVAGSARTFSVRLDARVPKPSVNSADPLLSALRQQGLVRPWSPGTAMVSDAVDTARDTGAVIGRDGAVVPGLYAVGLLTWDFRLHSLMAPVPGSNSLFFAETDCIAKHLVRHLYPADTSCQPVHLNRGKMKHPKNGATQMPQDQTGRTIVNTGQLVNVDEAARRRADGAVFIDVRRRDKGGPVPPVEGAVVVDKQHAVTVLDPSSPDLLNELADGLDSDIVVFCNSEFGSDPVVGQLNEFGYRRVSHINGGYRAWEASAGQ